MHLQKGIQHKQWIYFLQALFLYLKKDFFDFFKKISFIFGTFWFQALLAGRIDRSRGPHAARGPRV
jgi:hypothetical protein